MARTMLGHGRPLLTIRTSVISTLVATAVVFVPLRLAMADNAIATESLPIAWQDDAQLTDVFFINRQVGWAVGAQGVILRTVDGGKTWLQPSDVDATPFEQRVNESRSQLPLSEKLDRMKQGPKTRLSQRNLVADASRREIRVRFESVHFVDSQHGWVAGGYNLPWMDGSHGLIMRTSDGGKTWRPVERLTLPRVSKIHFTSRRTGWAIGETNALHPNGIYFTNDGGATWSDQSTKRMIPWTDGQPAGSQFVMIDQNGRLGLVAGGKLTRPALFGCSRDDHLTCLATQDDQNGFAAGPGGLLLKSGNGGRAWKRLAVDWENSQAPVCATVNEKHVYLGLAAGGIIRVNTIDHVVESIALPTSAPIRRIRFVDAKHGFAIGDFGTIISTSDGGQTWRKQRGDHDRLAILFVADEPDDLSLSLLAYNSGEDSRLCGTFLMGGPMRNRAVSVQAFERVGSVVNWRCRDSEDNQRINCLVAAIRSAKPRVVVCCHDLSSTDQYRNAMALQNRVNRAIDLAADPSYTGGQQSHWQVSRLLTSDRAGTLRLDSRRMMPTMGQTVADQIAVSRALLGQPVRDENFSNWRVTHLAKSRSMKGNDLLSGLASQGTPIPTRNRRTLLGNLNRMNEALHRQKQTENLSRMKVETDQDLAVWQRKILAVSATADEHLAGLWLVDLAEKYLESGRFEMVDRTLEALTTYWSDHAFAPAANAWLTVKRSQNAYASESASASQSAQRRTLEPFMRLTQQDPSLALDPAWQWIELNLLARSSGVGSVEPKLAKMAQLRTGSPQDREFARMAQHDLMLLHARGSLATDAKSQDKKNDLVSHFASERPKLDGILDEALWQNAEAAGDAAVFTHASSYPIHNADRIVLAHDDQYFYGAIHCQKLPNYPYRVRQGVRTRDPVLSQSDRIEWVIDPSLNFCGGIKLVIDHQGRVAESKLGGKDWNPNWYVANAQDEKTWSVEFALPLSEIAQQTPDRAVRKANVGARGWAVKACRLDNRSRFVWDGVENGSEKSGLQASLKPDPTGFRRMVFHSDSDSNIPMPDRRVRPVQYQLELDNGSNNFSNPPKAPDIGGLKVDSRLVP
jgi:photosystem II stability/assembly factor-like uncharacterized protein